MRLIVVLIILSVPLIYFMISNFDRVVGKVTARIGFVIATISFVVSALDPRIVTRIANALGVGRGTDLVTYFVAICLVGLSALSIAKFRSLEARNAQLVRHVAIYEFERNYFPDEP
jgi:hypothetical protein